MQPSFGAMSIGTRHWPGGAALAACLGLAAVAGAQAGERLQGLFCNTEPQIDAALANLAAGLDPRAAVDLVNRETVACTYVDLLHYVIEDPVDIGTSIGTSESYVPLAKYRGTLTGVVVGGVLRPVSPPVEVHFVTPEPLAHAVVERHT